MKIMMNYKFSLASEKYTINSHVIKTQWLREELRE
jgi:hypothetical protein